MVSRSEQKKSLLTEPKTPLELARMILELAEHGDYSNGNTPDVGYPDEGQVMAGDALLQYRIRLDEFEGEENSVTSDIQK